PWDSRSSQALPFDEAGEAAGHARDRALAERRGLEAAEQHVGERERQQRAGAVRIEAARAEIEHLVLVELADGRAVAALDVVGIDLEFRPRVDLRLVGE